MIYETDRVSHWLKERGFLFDPFIHLESSVDPHLDSYLVIYPELAPVWEDVSALVYAPIGGGKTALRLYATWSSLRGLFSFFPIPYALPTYWDHLPPDNFALHGRQFARACADAVLLLLATFPQRFLELSDDLQRELTQLLWQCSPDISLKWHIERWQQADWKTIITPLVEPALRGSFAPAPQRHIVEVAKRLTTGEGHLVDDDPFDSVKRILYLLIRHLGYRSIHLLIDGVDGFSETSMSPGVGQQWVDRWLSSMPDLLETSVRVKIFIPFKLRESVVSNGSHGSFSMKKTELRWNEQRLAEMLRQRIQVASQGKYSSLDDVSDLSILDFEMMLARSLPETPLPRELLYVSRLVIQEHVTNNNTKEDLQEKDVRAAIHRYHQGQSSRVRA